MKSRIRSRSDHPKKLKANSYHPLTLAIAIAFSSTLPSVSKAATFTVSNTNNSGAGSLRQAVFLSNGSAGADIIEFSIASGSTINISSEISITDSLTILGPAQGNSKSITIDAGGASRHFNGLSFPDNIGKTISLENITLTNGFIDADTNFLGYGGSIAIKNANLILNNSLISESSTGIGNTIGGGIYVDTGNLTLNDSVITGNSAHSRGGGIYVIKGNVLLNKSTVTGNSVNSPSSRGGGLFVFQGSLRLNSSTVSRNTSSNNAGGFYAYLTDVTLMKSTISENTTAGGSDPDGGGFYVVDADIDITQSTITENIATGASSTGGGFRVIDGNTVNIIESTISNNSAPTGAGGIEIASNAGDTTITNSILSGNLSTYGNINNTSANLIVNNSLFGDPLTEIDVNNNAYYDSSNDPKLGPLQHNGGFIKTHKPLPIISSQIINTAGNTTANTDQRGKGFSRIVDAQADMGAVELQTISGGVFIPPNPNEEITRRDMAREILKEIEGSTYKPPLASSTDFDDVNIGDVNADWIEEFHSRGFTEGCDTNKFCPNMLVTKEAMAKIYLKVQGINPPFNQVQSAFEDVPTGSFAWEEMSVMFNSEWAEGCNTIVDTSGPFPDINFYYCPKEPVTREWFNFLLNQL